MIKCHWTDHHHAFFKNNSGQFYECEYCDKVKISSYSVWQLLEEYGELTRYMTFSQTVAVEMAIVQYLWDRSEESRRAGIPPGAALLGLELHTNQLYSIEECLQQLLAYYQTERLVEVPNAETTQSPGCTQSPPRRPADYYSDLREEIAQGRTQLAERYKLTFLSKLTQLDSGSKPVPLLLEGTIYSLQSSEELLELYRSQSSIDPFDLDRL